MGHNRFSVNRHEWSCILCDTPGIKYLKNKLQVANGGEDAKVYHILQQDNLELCC